MFSHVLSGFTGIIAGSRHCSTGIIEGPTTTLLNISPFEHHGQAHPYVGFLFRLDDRTTTPLHAGTTLLTPRGRQQREAVRLVSSLHQKPVIAWGIRVDLMVHSMCYSCCGSAAFA